MSQLKAEDMAKCKTASTGIFTLAQVLVAVLCAHLMFVHIHVHVCDHKQLHVYSVCTCTCSYALRNMLVNEYTCIYIYICTLLCAKRGENGFLHTLGIFSVILHAIHTQDIST